MPTLYGRNWTRDELRRSSGTLRQIAGCAQYELTDGAERGVQMLDIRTGSGFRFCVCPSRGLDITFAEHNGRALCWNSSTGTVHPAFYQEDNLGWLRGFTGGLLTTCGFSSFGPPCEDEGETYGIHDRASYLPASNVAVSEEWKSVDGDDSYEISISGTNRETRVFGPNLKLTRRIVARLGESKLTVYDRLENDGFEPAPAVVLYHCNFGFPVVSENSVIEAPSAQCRPRDAAAEVGAENWAQLEAPQPGYAERVYFHNMTPDAEGFVRATIRNTELNTGAYIRYRAAPLPFFTQWKMMGAGDYVCGLEPSNAPLASRADLRVRGELPILQPGEALEFEVELGALD
ncbi:MAG TPA: aldose 1-epimerase family protein [Abditibacteriaceae bacterium]|jgi:hypothetical protein